MMWRAKAKHQFGNFYDVSNGERFRYMRLHLSDLDLWPYTIGLVGSFSDQFAKGLASKVLISGFDVTNTRAGLWRCDVDWLTIG